jgi:hypothetical protein
MKKITVRTYNKASPIDSLTLHGQLIGHWSSSNVTRNSEN